MSREHQQVNFRMPHEIVEELKIESKKEKRSVTAQLNAIVEEWLEKQKQKESAKA
ncbi:Arc family DNA-binding protein [Acinetobacter sp. B10A]|uniref:Arc family DNA-binding protein n=1 Tax=Acinetobacter baretiae TaxID=2605383 RepID=UPI001B3C9215|nr:Arc family DNA-binding protein [Acinetobacter baretiae]MBF7685970.1 Arc family DNA-binding protein [Acinetobacter baretiae]